MLEYNGIVLTGKTFEEVQRVTSQPNGEIELVIKAYVSSLLISFFINYYFIYQLYAHFECMLMLICLFVLFHIRNFVTF